MGLKEIAARRVLCPREGLNKYSPESSSVRAILAGGLSSTLDETSSPDAGVFTPSVLP